MNGKYSRVREWVKVFLDREGVVLGNRLLILGAGVVLGGQFGVKASVSLGAAFVVIGFILWSSRE